METEKTPVFWNRVLGRKTAVGPLTQTHPDYRSLSTDPDPDLVHQDWSPSPWAAVLRNIGLVVPLAPTAAPR